MTRLFAVAGLLFVMASHFVVAGPIAPFTLNDYRGATINSVDFADSKCLVVAFLRTECPLAKLYGSRLQQLV